MHRFLVLVLATGFVTADVGLGYNYYKPSTSFGSYKVPSYQASATTGHYNIGYNNANGFNYPNNIYPGLNAGLQNGANTVYQVNGGYQGIKPSIIKGDVLGSNSAFQNTLNSYQGIYNNDNIYKETAAYQGGNVANANYANLNGINKAQSSYQVQSQQAQVFKHFYVHAAPEDKEPTKPRSPIVLPPPQKHYKIIFIKAPTQYSSSPQIVPVPQQNEEKTIVYVLVNKPEDAQNIVLPKLEQKPPAKPEVYFIKYNNKQGSQAVIDNIVKDYKNDQSVSFTNIGTGVAPPSVLFGNSGTSGVQKVNSGSAGSSSAQNVANSGFSALSSQATYESTPLSISTSGISDGTLSSTIVGTGSTDTFKVNNVYNSASSGTGLNSASGSTGFNGAIGNAGYNGLASGIGFNSVSSSTELNSASAALNSESGSSGFNSGSNTNEYNSVSNGNEYSTVSGITSSGVPHSVTDSEYNGSTISTSQGLPHETYGIPKFSL